MAKHGNRSVSSLCGSADVLEALGVAVELGPVGVAQCVKDVGMGFMYAPRYHPAMKTVAPVRKSLKVRTAFNLLVSPRPTTGGNYHYHPHHGINVVIIHAFIPPYLCTTLSKGIIHTNQMTLVNRG